MPAKSIKQQRLMGMVYALKTGALKLKDLPDSIAAKVKSISKSITKSEAKKFASTKHKGLPEQVKEELHFPFSLTDYLILENILSDKDLLTVEQIMERVCPKTGKRYEDEESSSKNYSAYDEGYDACMAGKKKSLNPYSQKNTTEYNDWNTGWNDARVFKLEHGWEDEESSRPSSHLSSKERSEIVKRAKRGEDIGAPGKKFKEIEKSAAERYGSEEAGKRVAGAIMWKKVGK